MITCIWLGKKLKKRWTKKESVLYLSAKSEKSERHAKTSRKLLLYDVYYWSWIYGIWPFVIRIMCRLLVWKLSLTHLWVMFCHLQAASEVNPLLFTIATLTGHVIRAFGPNYSVSSHWNSLCRVCKLSFQCNVMAFHSYMLLPVKHVCFVALLQGDDSIS